jgi:hypothetical protein
LERCDVLETGVIDKDVHPTASAVNLGQHIAAAAGGRYVPCDRRDPVDWGILRRREISDHDLRPVRRQSRSDGRADSARSAGD